MDEYYLGYVFSAEELLVLFCGLDIPGTFGLPIRKRKLSSDEEMQTIRSLLRKKVLSWSEDEGYRIDERFRQAFSAMNESSYSISLISCNYPLNGYVCFAGEQAVVWEISGYMDDRFTLLIFDRKMFTDMLVREEFIPRLNEYCERLTDAAAEAVEADVEEAEKSGSLSTLKYPFVIKKTYADSVEYMVAVSSSDGNYIAEIGNGERKIYPYKAEILLDRIRQSLDKGESL